MAKMWVLALLGALIAAGTAGAELPARPDFEREVRPIFARHCFSCHGEKKQLGGLRLDERAAAFAGGDSGAAIIAGKAATSPLWERVTAADEDERMPADAPPLSAAEIGTLRLWINSGAAWPQEAAKPLHWSLRPLVRPAVPAEGAGAAPLDRFIAAKLSERGLQPSPPADRRTLLRRLSYDLTGLPPTKAEIDAFAADISPLAYEKQVDRLLASPRHGERWAQHWLDAVRFAESDGFETNKPRANAWPYRDYVIEAFNSDKPYDQFVREQLAGDVLGADAATGFLVAGANDVVRSPDPVLTAQQRADVLHDIVSTISSTFLGLTVGCARCHNHKFDPVPQADYYALKATVEGVHHGQRPIATTPAAEREAQLAQLRAELRKLDTQLLRLEPLAQIAPPIAEQRQRPAVHPRRNVERFAPIIAKRLRMTIHKTNTIEPCIDELEVLTAEEQPRNVALASAGATARASSVYPNSSIHKLEHINDGHYGNGRSWISAERASSWVELEFPQPVAIEAICWGRDRDEKYADRLPLEYSFTVADEAGVWTEVANHRDRETFVAGRKHVPVNAFGSLSEADRVAAQAAVAERSRLELEIKRLATPPTLYAGVFTSQPAETHRFHRGDPLQRREVIEPAGLRAISVAFALELPTSVALTADQRRRLALAEWLVDPANPLTARVIVNRLWLHHFGEGLVSTPSDFGVNGTRPSHPKLLDWLAAELLDHDWSLRHIHRLIVTSATYQQQSAARPKALARDAQSRLLWRYPPRRLDAESLRDSILAASGELDLAMGGPGFLAFEPNNNYVRVYNPKQEFGPGDFRRMIYMTKIRMHQDGTFGAFDCPDGGQIAPRRAASTTPLQALNLLNSPFLMQQAQRFAARVEAQSAAPADQVALAFRMALQRAPAAAELAACEQVVREHGLMVLCRTLFNSNEFLYLD